MVSKKIESPKFSKGGALPTLNAAAAGADFAEGCEAYYDEEDDDDENEKDFNANELLKLTDLQNKRLENKKVPEVKTPVANKRPALAAGADFEMDLDDEDSDEDGDGDDWGVPDNYVPNTDDLKDFDYSNTDLNKCGDYELKRHKLNMDKGFAKTQLKPGDQGFEYDKRVEFKQPAKDALE